MKNLIIRSITGLFFLFIVVSSILISSISFFVLFSLIIVLGMWEFFSLSEKMDLQPQKFVSIIIGLLLFVASYLFAEKLVDEKVFVVFVPLIFFLFIIELYKKSKSPFTNIAYSILGLIYIALPFTLLNFIVFIGETNIDIVYSPGILLGLFILLWVHDTGSYVFGVSFGKHRLFERISPKKSWEGFLGGSFTAILAGYFLHNYFPALSRQEWLIVAVIAVIAGTFGDLTESLFKRSLSVKDSGKLLPGHGGILDRFDSIILASPMVFTYLQLIK